MEQFGVLVIQKILEARKNYTLKLKKDEYIGIMENQLDQLINEMKKANARIKDLEEQLSNKLALNTHHLAIFKLFTESDIDEVIKDERINRLINRNIDLKIAFKELLDHGYISDQVAFDFDDLYYYIADEKKVEVLKIIKDPSKYIKQ
ncbi:hypothetical protein [Paracholeplasma manati]|uniref:hypothetical protein n=1 Tax=Paracholeplasma manati TaxID=591373 RepID=UPI00240792FD|nr:hypothetical protein [Paracholeplasma manati]MDG0887875.1 hypothetical protein [Paracholeplasma manati]